MAQTFATWNPSDKAANISLSNGNLTITKTQDQVAYAGVRATIAKTTGKWYWEVHIDGYGDGAVKAVATTGQSLTAWVGNDVSGVWNNGPNDAGVVDSGVVFTFTHVAAGNTVGFAYDADGDTLQVYVNNSSVGTLTTVTETYPFTTIYYAADVQTANFGATTMAYTAPSGYNQGLYDGEADLSVSVSDTLTITENANVTQVYNIAPNTDLVRGVKIIG